MNPWIGVDLDGTLAHYDAWVSPTHIGAPIPLMVERVKRWIAEGHEVRIFTARVGGCTSIESHLIRDAIEAWCREHIGVVLSITCIKDYGMEELWDDRDRAVEANTGRMLNASRRGLDISG